MTTRRTFLAVVGSGLAAVPGVRYFLEPQEVIVDHGPWVEDRGDFYIVRVPAGKSFAKEHLKKPTIFLLGGGASLIQVAVDGFVNIQAPLGGAVVSSSFDASQVRVGRNRPVVELVNSEHLILVGCYVEGNEDTSAGVHFGAGTYQLKGSTAIPSERPSEILLLEQSPDVPPHPLSKRRLL